METIVRFDRSRCLRASDLSNWNPYQGREYVSERPGAVDWVPTPPLYTKSAYNVRGCKDVGISVNGWASSTYPDKGNPDSRRDAKSGHCLHTYELSYPNPSTGFGMTSQAVPLVGLEVVRLRSWYDGQNGEGGRRGLIVPGRRRLRGREARAETGPSSGQGRRAFGRCRPTVR